MRVICRICTAMHSNAHPTTAHLRSIANSTACTRHHSTARRRTRRHSTARYGARGTLAALGAVLPRATDAPRYRQQGMPDRTKAGPRLLSFIFPSGRWSSDHCQSPTADRPLDAFLFSCPQTVRARRIVARGGRADQAFSTWRRKPMLKVYAAFSRAR